MTTNYKTTLWIIGLALLCFLLYYFRSVLSYVLISVVISIVGGPLVDLFNKIKIGKYRMPASLSAALTLLIMIGFFVGLFSIFGPLVAEEAEIISSIDVEKTAETFNKPLGETERFLEKWNLSGDEQSNKEFLVSKLKSLINFGQLGDLFNNVFGVIGNFFIAFFSILFIAFFFLKDGNMVARIAFVITPDKHLDKIKEVMEKSKIMLRRYFIGLIVQISIMTVLVTAGLSILGIKNAFLIGFLAGIINLIPYLGPILGAIIAMVITLSSGLATGSDIDLLSLTLKVGGVFAVCQLVDNFITQPFIFSNSVKAHPLEIFIVISIAGTLGGVSGMIIAIPAYTFIRIIAQEFLSGFKLVDSLTRNL